MMKPPILIRDDGTGEHEDVVLPSKVALCGHCEGKGKSSSYLGAFTQEAMDEMGRDFQDDYMAGRYDRACDHCDGEGRILVADRARMTKEQRKAWDEQCRDDREYRALCAAEQRMGA